MRRYLAFLHIGAVCFLLICSAGTVHAQEPDLTNARVIELSKLGLDDEIIISKIKAGVPKFMLADTDLMDLKKAGVSAKVIASMLDISILSAPRVMIDNKQAEIHTLGQAKVGGRLGNVLTGGIKSVKSKAFLQNPHSMVVGSSNPVIAIELPKR